MRVKTRGKAVTLLMEWKKSYERQFQELVREMDRAKSRGDLRTVGFCIGQLDGMQKNCCTESTLSQNTSSSRTFPPWIRRTPPRYGKMKNHRALYEIPGLILRVVVNLPVRLPITRDDGTAKMNAGNNGWA